jgi:hypothetical protein
MAPTYLVIDNAIEFRSESRIPQLKRANPTIEMRARSTKAWEPDLRRYGRTVGTFHISWPVLLNPFRWSALRPTVDEFGFAALLNIAGEKTIELRISRIRSDHFRINEQERLKLVEHDEGDKVRSIDQLGHVLLQRFYCLAWIVRIQRKAWNLREGIQVEHRRDECRTVLAVRKELAFETDPLGRAATKLSSALPSAGLDLYRLNIDELMLEEVRT